MSRVGLYVRFRARPGERETLVQLLLTAADHLASVPGCQAYVVNASPDDPDTVWVTEIWRSADDHDASLAAPGVHDLVAQAKPLLATAPERINLVPLGGAGLAP